MRMACRLALGLNITMTFFHYTVSILFPVGSFPNRLSSSCFKDSNSTGTKTCLRDC